MRVPYVETTADYDADAGASVSTSIAPRLSICIPAYNGAWYLRVMLEALLPQVAQSGGAAEVLVLDDASTDQTAGVVDQSRHHGPVRYIRSPANLGSARNIVRGPVEFAKGEFVCVWSQHCLVAPGALERLLRILSDRRQLDAFYINFRCAVYPRDWPEQAVGGYDGPHDYLSNPDLADRDVGRWEQLLDARSCVCTQSYAHIVRRSIWVRYWKGRSIGDDFTSVFTTYPHTCTVAEHMFGKPSYYVGSPVLTIFNGAQWWSSVQSRSRVYLRGYPELLCLYRRLGWAGDGLRAAWAWNFRCVEGIAGELFRAWRRAEGGVLARYVLRYGSRPGIWLALWRAFLASQCCWLARILPRIFARLDRVYRYCFFNCRPARWVRSRLAQDGMSVSK